MLSRAGVCAPESEASSVVSSASSSKQAGQRLSTALAGKAEPHSEQDRSVRTITLQANLQQNTPQGSTISKPFGTFAAVAINSVFPDRSKKGVIAVSVVLPRSNTESPRQLLAERKLCERFRRAAPGRIAVSSGAYQI